jgi:hypothetical protein
MGTNISEEPTDLIFRLKKYSYMLAMKATGSSEMMMFIYSITRRHIRDTTIMQEEEGDIFLQNIRHLPNSMVVQSRGTYSKCNVMLGGENCTEMEF